MKSVEDHTIGELLNHPEVNVRTAAQVLHFELAAYGRHQAWLSHTAEQAHLEQQQEELVRN